MNATLAIGILIGITVCFVAMVAVGHYLTAKEPPSPEVTVTLYAMRRRRELDEFKRDTKLQARRLRHELRQELRLLDDTDQ